MSTRLGMPGHDVRLRGAGRGARLGASLHVGDCRHGAVYPGALLQQFRDGQPLVCQVQGLPAQAQVAVNLLFFSALQQFLPSAIASGAAHSTCCDDARLEL